MGLRKKLGNGEEKKVTFNRKEAGKVKRPKGKKEYEAYDAEGKLIGTFNDENTATEKVRKSGRRDQENARGGGLPGQEYNQRPAGESRKHKRQPPGSGKNPQLWKNVKKNDDK